MRIIRAFGIALVFASPAIGDITRQIDHPRTFAVGLARSGLSIGMVVEKGLLSDGKPSPVTDPNVLQGETLQAAMARFNRSTPDVRASEHSGVVRIQSANLPPAIQAELNRAVYVPPVEGVLVWEAVFVKALGLLAGREPQGFAGTGIGEGAACGLDRRIRLGGEATVTETLDAVVRQAPGLIWVITYSDDNPLQTMEIGVLCPDGRGQLATVNF